MVIPDENKLSLPLEISVITTQKNNLPCLELRRVTTNNDIIKAIVSCAFHGRPIIIQPTFKDKMHSIGSLIEKGIIYRKDDQFFFTI